jgi:ketosteroid isomerase-like protein
LEEFANRLTPVVKTRDLAAALEAAERGKRVMSRQKYKIKQEIAEGDRVALEVEWVGTLAVPFGSIPVGGQMKAFFAVFLEFREGKIIRQRNYDCFEA